jgi:hypothetical protein
MKTQLMQVDTTSGNRMYAEDIQYGANVYTEIFRGGMGITGATNSGIFKIFGIAVSGTSIQITKGALLIYYNGTSSSTIVDQDQIAVCRYNGNDVTIDQGTAFNLYVGYNETQRVNEGGSNYIAYRDYFFQTTSFSGSKLTLSVPANLTIPELMKQYGWNYPMPKSFTFDLLETPVDAEDILTEGSVGTDQLGNYCVTSDRIANGAVGTDQLNVNEVNGMFFDYTISNISQFGTVFNNILSRGSYKVRILAGEYNITQSYNLGNTSSGNKVDIYCDPGVVLNGFLSENVLSNLSVINDTALDNSVSGGVTLHGGKINAIFQSGSSSNSYSVISGFSGIYNCILCLPQNITSTQTELSCVLNSSNIDNIIVDLISTSYTSNQSGKIGVIFSNCENITNVYVQRPKTSTNNSPYVHIFVFCKDISNVKIDSIESNKLITYFYSCYNISGVSLTISGIFDNSSQKVRVFTNCFNITNVNIMAQNYGYTEESPNIVQIFGSCSNISGVRANFTDVMGTGNNQMITLISSCTSVSHVFASGRSPMKGFIVLSKGVTNNYIYSASQLSSVVYSQSYASYDTSVPCDEGINGGLNYIENLSDI